MLKSGIWSDESFVPSTTTANRASSVPRYVRPTRSFVSHDYGKSYVSPRIGEYVATS